MYWGICAHAQTAHQIACLTMATHRPVSLAIIEGHLAQRNLSVDDIVRMGAPLRVVMRMLERRGFRRRAALFLSAIAGGNVEVCQWVHNHIYGPVTHDQTERDCICDCTCGARPPSDQRHVLGEPARYSIPLCMRNMANIGNAIQTACDREKIDALHWLLQECARSRLQVANHVLDTASSTVALKDRLDMYMMIHRHIASNHFHAPNRPCSCDANAHKQAIKGDALATMVWMRSPDGCAMCLDNLREQLDTAVRSGSIKILRWLVANEPRAIAALSTDSDDLLPAGGTLQVIRCTTINKAVARNYIDVIALLHETGIHPCTLEVLVTAAKGGSLDVLKWAAGELPDAPVPMHVHYGPHISAARCPRLSSDGQETVAAVPAWGDLRILFASLHATTTDTFCWLIKQPDVRRTITVPIVRNMLRATLYTKAIKLFEEGVVPIDTWDVLRAAVQGNVGKAGVASLIDMGARYSKHALCTAVRRSDRDIVALLCERFGATDLQAAIDAVPNGRFSVRGLCALQSIAPSLVCIRHVLSLRWIFGVPSCDPDGSVQCRCSACAATALP